MPNDNTLPPKFVPFVCAVQRLHTAMRLEAEQLARNFGLPEEATVLAKLADELDKFLATFVQKASSRIVQP